MKNIKFSALVCLTFAMTSVVASSVLNDDLEQFLERCAADKAEQQEFRGYYSRFLDKQSKQRRNSKDRALRKLRSSALNNLERHHPKWYKEVEHYVFDLEEQTQEARKVRLFLTRFALFEEYREEKLGINQSFWKKTKGYLKSMGTKVVELKDKAFNRNKYAKA